MADYEAVESDFSEMELEMLENLHIRHCFTNSLVDYHESNDEEDDGNTVFSYTETRRYM